MLWEMQYMIKLTMDDILCITMISKNNVENHVFQCYISNMIYPDYLCALKSLTYRYCGTLEQNNIQPEKWLSQEIRSRPFKVENGLLKYALTSTPWRSGSGGIGDFFYFTWCCVVDVKVLLNCIYLHPK